jgi:hypothetical protein
MKTRLSFSYLLAAMVAVFAVAPLRAVESWREVTVPTVAEAAAAFTKPPLEYGAIHWAIWGGPQTMPMAAVFT